MKTISPFRGIQYFKYLGYLEAHCALIEQLAINSNSTSNSELSVCQPAAYLIGPVIHCSVGNGENVSMELFDDLLISDNLRCNRSRENFE